MTEDPRVQQLLDELLDSRATPEEVCETCPELLPVVRNRWRQIHRLRADLDVLFPSADKPTPPPDWEALPQIPGYELETVLGRGGMGVVFKAQHLKLKRFVALKMMLAGTYASPEELVRFRRETEAIAALRHPHIVQVHDAGEVAGRPYFTMEYVEGGTLGQALSAKPLSPRHAAELLATLASAIQFAHRSGFIHRDIKPANVLLAVDGMAKVTDFGLARTIEAGPEVTQSGAPIGTPSYMAPEQAQGRAGAVGPAADIYALGAVLYEMLTGQPPFEGESACETIHKVVTEEATPPSRLNPKIPRDLDTICLKCLQKAPPRRYASAQDLADDLHRFLDGKPVRARPVGMAERAAKWARRRPAAAMLAAAILVMLGAAAGTGAWLYHQETDRRMAKDQRQEQARAAIETALNRAGDLQREERWKEALNVLTDAEAHLGEANSPELDQRLRKARTDFQIARDLDRVRESRTVGPGGMVEYQRQAVVYQGIFERAGLRLSEVEPTVAAIRVSAIRDQFAAALDDWAVVAFTQKDAAAAARLLEIARSANPEPRWGDRFRTLAVWESAERLRDLADDAFTAAPHPPGHQLALLGLLLSQKGFASRHMQFLRGACRRYPGNFWFNREMGFALRGSNRNEAAGYYRVALAARPDSARIHEELASVLFLAGDIEEALAEYRQAVECAPYGGDLRGRFIQRLAEAGYWKDAAAECRRGLEIEPKNALLPLLHGLTLADYQRDDEAIAMLRKAIEIHPSDAGAHYHLGRIFARTGRHEKAASVFRALVDLHPSDSLTRERLAGELAATGRPEQAITELRAVIAQRPTAGAYMAHGALLRSQGRLEEAAEAFQSVIPGDTGPAWEGLAAVRLDQGRFADARAAIESLLKLPANDARHRAQRRQLELCDLLIAVESKLRAILAGKERPTDAATQHALAVWCQKHKRLTATAAGFYTSAFAAQPSLADDLEAGNQFQAARAAALAGCGVGEDAVGLDDPRRTVLRRQALDWLKADYTAWAEKHRTKPVDRTVAATAVRAWLNDTDLAGIRDEPGLAKLPADERQDWQAFWDKVTALAACDPAALIARARAHVARTEWKDAAKCYAEGMELAPTDDGVVWFEYAASQLLAGDLAGYRRSCAYMVARCQPAGRMRPYLVARACTLASDSTDDPAQVRRLAQSELDRNADEFWSLTELGALYVRTGRPTDAVPQLEWSLVADGRPGRAVLNWLWLALACQKLDRPAEARRWLVRSANWLDQQDARMPRETSTTGLHLHNWLEAHVLRQEAEAVLR
jgi:serine/threonine-protein kinase